MTIEEIFDANIRYIMNVSNCKYAFLLSMTNSMSVFDDKNKILFSNSMNDIINQLDHKFENLFENTYCYTVTGGSIKKMSFILYGPNDMKERVPLYKGWGKSCKLHELVLHLERIHMDETIESLLYRHAKMMIDLLHDQIQGYLIAIRNSMNSYNVYGI